MPKARQFFAFLWRQRFIGLALVAFAAAILAAIATPWHVSGQEKKSALSALSEAVKKPATGKSEAPATEEPKDGVVLSGHLSRDWAGPGEKIRFWITVTNKTASPIQQLRFSDFFVPGFERPPRIFGGCRGASWDKICDSLGAQETVTAWGDLSAGEDAFTKENAYAVLAWDTAARPGQSGTAGLGEIERLSLWAWIWRWLSRWDIGLPVLTGILTFFYQLRKNRKAKKEAAEKDHRKSTERREAEQRQQYEQTWNLMLPQANRFSLRYYIPTANSVLTALADLAVCQAAVDANPGNPSPPDKPSLAALFDLVQLQWHRLRMKRAIGGYYFKSRTAESVTEALYQKHRLHFGVVPPERFLVLAKFVKPLKRNWEAGDFVEGRGSWDAEQKQFFVDFKAWVSTEAFKADIIVLGAMWKVLWYESNRPFQNWYQEQPPVVLTPEERNLITQIGEEENATDPSMGQRVANYLTEITTAVPAPAPVANVAAGAAPPPAPGRSWCW